LNCFLVLSQLYIGPREVQTIEDALRRFAAPETLDAYKVRMPH